MAIKLLCLKSGERIVADVENAIIKDKPYGYLLTRPCLVFVGQETDELDTIGFGPGVDEELGEELSDEELQELQNDDPLRKRIMVTRVNNEWEVLRST